MLSWLGYMKHGEPQVRVMGLKMPPPNLKPDYTDQASKFVDGLVDGVLRRPVLPRLYRRDRGTHKRGRYAR